MPRLFGLTVGAALAAVTVMFCVAGLAEAQVKPADPTFPQELSLYAGSKSCIECHAKFYQLWSTYTLTYDPESDQLKGVYFQAVQQQTFDVVFVRMK